MLRLLALLLMGVCCRSMAAESPAFPAGPVRVEINAAQSTVRFTLGALLHTVHGTFKVKTGSIRFDPVSGQASGQIAVNLRSGETGDDARDRQMHENVLQSSQFPEAVFSPDRVKGRIASSGDSQIEVHGSMRIHGGEHDITIPVKVSLQKDRVTATAKFVVPYVAWGLKDPSNLVLRVDKTVNVEVALNGSVATRSGESSVRQKEELAKATAAAAAISR